MRGYFIFLFFIFLIINVSAMNLTGDSITGKPLQILGVNITVTAGPPVLSITYPLNSTYLVNSSIPLNYSIAGEIEKTWYKIDSGNNITLNSSVYINTSEGSHVLYLYANNSHGTTIKNVSFSINSSKFIIIGDKWVGDNKGNSTNFTILSYLEIQNLSNIILEDTNYGKISFNQNINLTNKPNISENQIDINSSIIISLNRIEINSTALSNFNKSATLELYGLTFSNPRILRDGIACPDSICTRESYSGGTLRFNVTHFSVYSSEETPVTVPPVSTGGGGGGGGIFGITSKVTSFNISTDEIKISTMEGKVITEKIIVKNNLNKYMEITLTSQNLEDFLVLKENKLNLAPNESKEISLDFMIREGTPLNMYLGKLILTNNNNEQKEILTVIEVQSEGALLDVTAEIQPEYLEVSPGHDILAKISLLNVKSSDKRRDISVEYIIKDENGKEILEDKETIAVETQTSWVKRFKIPSGVEYGKYVLYVKTTTEEGKVASASDTFNVVFFGISKISLLAISFIIVIMIISYFITRKIRKNRSIKQKNQKKSLKQKKDILKLNTVKAIKKQPKEI
jgi:hypothetical protein